MMIIYIIILYNITYNTIYIQKSFKTILLVSRPFSTSVRPYELKLDSVWAGYLHNIHRGDDMSQEQV
jgi:hypothetical protein